MILPVFAHPGPHTPISGATWAIGRPGEITSSTAPSLYFWLYLLRSVMRRRAPNKLSHKTIRPHTTQEDTRFVVVGVPVPAASAFDIVYCGVIGLYLAAVAPVTMRTSISAHQRHTVR